MPSLEKDQKETSTSGPPGDRRPKAYKEEQGRLGRMAAFWSLALFLLFGCTSFYRLLQTMKGLAAPIAGIQIPIVGVELSPAFLISALLFIAGLVAVQRWLKTPKMADLLIDTEGELKKVAWPTLQEVTNSSLVVILCVVLIGAFLAVVDLFLARIMRVIILGEA